MSNPSSLVFALCTTIDRFYEREPGLLVSDVLAALDEVSMALARAGAPEWSAECGEHQRLQTGRIAP
jgi:hypothetical protein